MTIQKKIRARIAELSAFNDPAWLLALSFSVGVFIGITPLFGLHTILAFVTATLFRFNKIATVAGAWLNLPWIAPFVYLISYIIGQCVLSFFNPSSLSVLTCREDILALFSVSLNNHMFFSLSEIEKIAKPLFIGTTIVGLISSFIFYFIMYSLIQWMRNRRSKQE